MYKIGIIGHGPEYFGADSEKIKRAIRDTINLLGFQYGNNDVIFNVAGEIGVGIWSLNQLYEYKFKYHLYLPYSIENTCEHWYEEQKETLRRASSKAYSITCCYPGLEIKKSENNYYNFLVDNSNFVICFWIGKRQGKTYNAIRYSLENNKLILNGLNDLKLITNKDI